MTNFNRAGGRWQGGGIINTMPAPVSAPNLDNPADIAAVAKAIGQKEGQDDENKLRIAELEKRIANQDTQIEGMRKRIIELERPLNAPIIVSTPILADANPALITPELKDVPGLQPGAVLRVEKGQSVDAFRKEYNLDDTKFGDWLKGQFPAVLVSNAENFTDPSWETHKPKST